MVERAAQLRRRSRSRPGAVLRRRPIRWRPRLIVTPTLRPEAARADAEIRRLVAKSF